jgi:hypothetical protein
MMSKRCFLFTGFLLISCLSAQITAMDTSKVDLIKLCKGFVKGTAIFSLTHPVTKLFSPQWRYGTSALLGLGIIAESKDSGLFLHSTQERIGFAAGGFLAFFGWAYLESKTRYY